MLQDQHTWPLIEIQNHGTFLFVLRSKLGQELNKKRERTSLICYFNHNSFSFVCAAC